METLQLDLGVGAQRLCERPGCANEIRKRAGSRFCSRPCYLAVWRSAHATYPHLQPATCPRCTMEFLPSDTTHRMSTQVYCSRQCVNGERYGSAPTWRGGVRVVCSDCGGDRGDSASKQYCRSCLVRRMLWSTYRITPEQLAAKLAEQAGRCPVGGEVLEVVLAGRSRIRVDHDHATGAVRGVLCHGHNIGLGYFGEDPATLRRAADYLDGILSA